jgi:hypothetical protein
MTFDITLGLGDTKEISATLSDANGVVNLTSASVKFIMNSEFSTTAYEINCTNNNSSGGTKIPFTSTESAKAGEFVGQFLVTIDDKQSTFPDSQYVRIKIIEGLTRPTGA